MKSIPTSLSPSKHFKMKPNYAVTNDLVLVSNNLVLVSVSENNSNLFCSTYNNIV
jgi:hypothetical protein